MMKRSILPYLFLIVSGLFSLQARAQNFDVEEISLLSINSAITPATFDYLQHHLKAMPSHALIIIKINTPGGLVTTTKDIITLLGKQDRPVAVWITPEGASASSAGAIIASSAHFIFMAPGTNMGAATPVGLGEDLQESDGKKKALNDLTALVRSLSDLRGRPAQPFEEMILKATSFTDQEALKAKIITGVVSTESKLIETLEGLSFKSKGIEYKIKVKAHAASTVYNRSWGQELLEVLANPQTAYFLFLIGIALIYFEFQAPGGYIMGGLGFIFIILAAISFQVLPLNWGALGLLLLGLILGILEIFVTSYGILGVSGLVAFVLGSLFLFHDEGGFISIEYSILFSTLAGVAVSAATVGWFLFKDRKAINQQSHFFLPIGTTGSVMTATGGVYQIKVKGEIWKAVSTESLSEGDSIKVTYVDTEKLLLHIQKDKESL